MLGVLAATVWAGEKLGRMRGFRSLGSALLVIVLAAAIANLGLIPTYRAGDALYDGIFSYVAPLGVFWLLLAVRLKEIRRAGPAMLLMFFVGAAGTTVGVLVAYHVVDLRPALGEHAPALAGMFVGTYTGGSVNFSAVAMALGVQERGALFAGATAVDALMTTVWMIATIVIPKWMTRRAGGPAVDAAPGPEANPVPAPIEHDVERAAPRDLAALLALGTGTLVASKAIPEQFAGQWMIVLTTVALLLAQLEFVHRLRGARMLGMTAILIFLAVIGVLCDVRALAALGPLGGTLFGFVAVVLLIHGSVVFGGARLLRQDPMVAAVCSQANVGGGTTALALARGLEREDLVLPAILVGSVGTAVGTHLGLLVVWGLG